MHPLTRSVGNWRKWLVAAVALWALALVASCGADARSEDDVKKDEKTETKKEDKKDAPPETLAQRLKRYDDDLAKLRDAMVKDCDAEEKKLAEALQKAKKDLDGRKGDKEAHRKAIEAVNRIQADLSNVQHIRQAAEHRVLLPQRPRPVLLPEDQRVGVHVAAPSIALSKQLSLEKDRGIVVERVDANSPAAKAELQPYDVLVQIDGKPVPSSTTAFRKLLADVKPDTPVDAVVFRKAKQETIKGLVVPSGNAPPK
jgi:C-terminal processing protease CtpA/Prc